MAYNFLACDRDQAFLLPPAVRDWLPADHLAWFVLDVVDQLDLTGFYTSYCADGHGRAAYQPGMLLGVLLYAYAIGVRSSCQIERTGDLQPLSEDPANAAVMLSIARASAAAAARPSFLRCLPSCAA
jgi:hypothetical protein